MEFQQLVLPNGYQMKSTFWMDFTIADRFGLAAVQDTYNRAFKEWHTNVIYVTELAVVLNYKIWQHYETNEPLAELYDRLWREVDEWCCTNLNEEDYQHYWRVTD